jgi:hypothetical protein
MSTHYVDQIVAVAVPALSANGPFFIVVHQGGDNNLIDTQTNRRSKSWYPAAIGREWEVLSSACEQAAACCGGCLVLASIGRRTTPEAFIRAYRKALANALTLEQAQRGGLTVQGRVRVLPEMAERARELRALHGVDGLVVYQEKEYGQTYDAMKFSLADPKQAGRWSDVRRKPYDAATVHAWDSFSIDNAKAIAARNPPGTAVDTSHVAWDMAASNFYGKRKGWVPITPRLAESLLGVVPPIERVHCGFMVGEAYTSSSSGEAVHLAVKELDDGTIGVQLMTVAEWKALATTIAAAC